MYQQPLTQDQAIQRANLFQIAKDNLVYKIFLKLKPGDVFEGKVDIQFELVNISDKFFIDFAGPEIKSFTINNKPVTSNDAFQSLRNDRFLTIPHENLTKGKNNISIEYTASYVNDGNGLHKFVDVDSKTYYYSTMCPFNCNKVFPCFDQPDLKALFEFTLAYPKGNVVVSNEPIDETKTKSLNKADFLSGEEVETYEVTAFKPTPPISTYLVAVICGPFTAFHNPNPYRGIPMAIYCRESLAQYVKDDAEELFEIVTEGIKFYEPFFGCEFPFGKFDFIFCPEFFYGAMENPGAITFNDARLVFKEPVVIERRTARLVTVVHELSHMWFGNLVTMKWWNDIWLNESFADFISFLCLHNIAPHLKSFKPAYAWHQFFNRKGWGYTEDQLRTTHPIAGSLENTDQAMTIFDGITYSKGAACLKQLLHLIGQDNFSQGIQRHFKKFAWSNATLDDLISSLDSSYKPAFPNCPSSLKEWKDQFLSVAGLNECLPEIITEEGKIILKVTQTAALSNFPLLRNHKMKVAFFDSNAEIFAVQDIVLRNDKETFIETSLKEKPTAVLLNYQDEAFIKVKLDKDSLEFFSHNLNKVKEDLTRIIIWKALWDMVRDAQLSSYDFVTIVVRTLPEENSDLNLTSILNYTNEVIGSYAPAVLRANILCPMLFPIIKEKLLKCDPNNKNRIILLKENLISYARYGKEKNVDNIQELISWFEGKNEDLKQFELTLDNKRNIVEKLMLYPKDIPRTEYLEKVLSEDKTDSRVNFEKKCRAILSTSAELEELWKKFLDPSAKESVPLMSSIMRGYASAPALDKKEFEKRFFDSVEDVFKTRSKHFAQQFFMSLMPGGENLKYYAERLSELLERASNDVMKKRVGIALDDVERKIRAYRCSSVDVARCFFDINI